MQILRTLTQNEVRLIVVGGVCASLHGAPVATFDLDVVHARDKENIERALKALNELGAYYRAVGDRKIQPTKSHLESPGHQLLMTRHGPLDFLGTIDDGLGYEHLEPHTTMIDIGEGLRAQILNLREMIRIKEKLSTDKDRLMLRALRHVLKESQCLE